MILALNDIATMRRAKPGSWLAISGISCLFALAGLALFDPSEVLAWATVLFFGGGAAIFLLFGLVFRGKPYRAGHSFRYLRGPDRAIGQGHKAAWAFGIAVILGYAIYGLVSRSVFNGLDGLVAGLGIIAAAYYAARAKRAHLNVDSDAVALSLRIEPEFETPVLAYANFEGEAGIRKGRAVLLVTADSLTVSECDGTAWDSRKRSFSDLRELGLASEADHSLQIYLRFAQGDQFGIRMDPMTVGTADPLTFCRAFLEILDRFLTRQKAPAAG
jgi:hypothetical protein